MSTPRKNWPGSVRLLERQQRILFGGLDHRASEDVRDMENIEVKPNNDEAGVAPGVKRVACEVYSRIVGYLRPVADWNKGKQQEFSERKTYQAPGAGRPAASSH